MTDAEFSRRAALIRDYFGDDTETAEHSIRVGAALRAKGCTDATVEAGLLHDAREDNVADGCRLLADDWLWQAVNMAAVMRRSPEHTYRQYIHAMAQWDDITAIKIADIKDNLITRGPPPGNLAKRYEWALGVLEGRG